MSEGITYENLRLRGFRIEWPLTDGRPRMILTTNPNEDQMLELCPRSDRDWHCWLRSDCSHRRARFIHIRPLRFIAEVDRLFEGITGRPLLQEGYDPERFAESLERARSEGERDWKQYCDREHAQDFIARFC